MIQLKSPPEFTGLGNFGNFPARQVGTDYNRQSETEYEAIKGFIGNPTHVMDLGCGLGRMSIFVNRKLTRPGVHFVLADASEVTHKDNISGWNPGRDFYNDLQATEIFCNENGLTNITLFDVNKDDVSNIGKIDLLFSFLAIGFHFPIEESLQKFWSCLHADSTLIFGVRQKRYSVRDFADYFNECYLVESTVHDFQKQTRKQHFLVLKHPRSTNPPPLSIRRGRLLKGDIRWMRCLYDLFKKN
jgi:hypothetical protein